MVTLPFKKRSSNHSVTKSKGYGSRVSFGCLGKSVGGTTPVVLNHLGNQSVWNNFKAMMIDSVFQVEKY